MITGIFFISVLVGIFSRSFKGFLISLFALVLLIYPIPTIASLLLIAAFMFFSNKGNSYDKYKQSAKHHLGGNRDINK